MPRQNGAGLVSDRPDDEPLDSKCHKPLPARHHHRPQRTRNRVSRRAAPNRIFLDELIRATDLDSCWVSAYGGASLAIRDIADHCGEGDR